MKKNSYLKSAIICLCVIVFIFAYLAYVMGTPNMLNTMMKTAHDLLLNTVFYLMAICVLTGAIGKLFMEFGVVTLLQKMLQPLMKPLFNLPGVAALGAVLTFLSDNPAIIGLSKDKKFSCYFKKFQLISLTNFGTAFGMGLIVIVFMVGQGYYTGAFVGLFGAICGCIISTRFMQYFICKDYPEYLTEDVVTEEDSLEQTTKTETKKEHEQGTFIKILNALLDGGKSGVDIGIAIIPGVLIISTLVMMLTFGGSAEGVDAAGNVIVNYTGAAYEGTQLLPWLFGKINFLFDWLFGFGSPELVAFPITALGAVGAALGLIPEFSAKGIIDGNAIAVFTAMGMCWSGYLSTHTAMLDSLGYRKLLSRAFLSHFLGGLGAGFVAHWIYVGVMAISAIFDPEPVWTMQVDGYQCMHEQSINVELTSFDDGTYTIKNWYGNEGQDLCFTVNENDSTLNIINSYSVKSGYYFVRISKEDHAGEPAYAAIYPGDGYSRFLGAKDRGTVYTYAVIYDGRKRQLTRGYYELTWGGALRLTGEAEEVIRHKIEEERAEAIREADSIRQQELVDSILMIKQRAN